MTEGLIHKFRYKDLNIVLDVNSGAVHLVDEPGWKVIELMERGLTEKEVKRELENTFSQPYQVGKALEEVKELKEKGLLFSRDFLENYTRPPEYLVKALCFNISHDCNMSCRYCFASEGSFGGRRSLMPREVAFRGIDFLIENSPSRKNCEVDFFGGEPLLNFPLIKETVDYARRRGKEAGKEFKFTVTTNGLLLREEVMEYLDGEDFSVVLSLDGRKEVNDRLRPLKEGGGTYDLLVPRYLSFLEGRGHQDYYLRGTYTRHNLDFSHDFQHLVELGFRSISLEPVVASPESSYALQEEDLPLLFQEYEKVASLLQEYHQRKKPASFFHFNLDLSQGPCIKKRMAGCGAGTEYLALSPEGGLYPCHQFVGQEGFFMGNVLKDLTYDKKLYAKFLKLDVNHKEDCRQCWAKFFCGGGCHANAYNFNGDLEKPCSLGCELEKKRIECALALKAYQYLQEKR
ncbi:MAG: thioether cross-link-forming SCIFF peptide maturase [Candidatus Syntrophonatronum acetioxidans]|uniref:Thioether cross-link-forming SCIFF peptide maturase n=1 Tax=Candidatus Syntrophonatronum acetioxidans TaxID=1795816 RepID=A0A424YHQ0_9FIRM|nr:MAG: thioether cross-link-forming SCIFF peptide maturase [Candidatus Syntrophonatronum acetioxidans]